MQQITDTVPLYFYILPSYGTGKSVQQITDTVPLCFYILPSYETGKSVQQITHTVPYVSTFCQVTKLGNQCSADN